MTSSLKRGSGRQSDALAWRRDVNRQHEVALIMAKDYQAAEKKRRTKEHNEALSRLDKVSVPRKVERNARLTVQKLHRVPKMLWSLHRRLFLRLGVGRGSTWNASNLD
ncbi:hypothetical protein PC110_g21767 [Phytophthora cactorum]|nr:hypothetical protein PC110_g21767 [Phytophthora cactorum]